MKKLISMICLTLSISTSAIAQYVADYDPVGNTLSLPWVKIGDSYYSNVILSVPPGEPWSLLRSGTQMNSVPASSAIYDQSTSILSIPAVSVFPTQAARKQTRSTSDESPTLVGGVEVSLGDGDWAVTRVGSSTRVTSSGGISTITGTIVDRFYVECKVTTSGTTMTETCTNHGFDAGEAFGLDTDGDGDQDQVWKVHDGANPSQCLTIQANIWDNVPHDNDTWIGDDAAEVGTIDAQIYTHPDGLYLMRYGRNSDWLSCIVVPVSGVPAVVLNNSSNGGAITLSSAQLIGEVGDVLNFYILGGTPPYTVISENTALASVAFGSTTTNKGQSVTVTLNSTGQSNADTANTQIFVFDWFQNNAAIPVTVNKVVVDTTTGGGGSGGATAALSVTPSGVEDFTVGTRFHAWLTGGAPPYYVKNLLGEYIEVNKVSDDTYEVYLATMPFGSSELTGALYFYDSSSPAQYTTLSLKFVATPTQYNAYR